MGPPKLQRLPRGGRCSWEQWWAQWPGAENAAARGTATLASPFSREEVGKSREFEPMGLMYFPGWAH